MKTLKIILLLFCIILGLNAKAQTVGYTYKALAAEGCNMKYSVAKQDTIYSIVATVRSDRMNFLTYFGRIILAIIHQRWIVIKIIQGCIMVFARLFMVTSTHIIWKDNLSLTIYVFDKALFLSTLRT